MIGVSDPRLYKSSLQCEYVIAGGTLFFRNICLYGQKQIAPLVLQTGQMQDSSVLTAVLGVKPPFSSSKHKLLAQYGACDNQRCLLSCQFRLQAEEFVPLYAGLCSAGLVPVLSVSLVCTLHGNGRSQQGIGNQALELGEESEFYS